MLWKTETRWAERSVGSTRKVEFPGSWGVCGEDVACTLKRLA